MRFKTMQFNEWRALIFAALQNKTIHWMVQPPRLWSCASEKDHSPDGCRPGLRRALQNQTFTGWSLAPAFGRALQNQTIHRMVWFWSG